jgi:transcriptional regulator with XRE-family HTH domain
MTHVPMQLVPQLEPMIEPSPLASARIHRKLTVEEAARRAGLPPEQLEWLEEGRVYRFPSADDALVATILYATALGIDNREARGLARLPVEPQERVPITRLIGIGAAVVLVAAFVLAVLPRLGGGSHVPKAKPLAPPWTIEVDVLNGGGDIYYTRGLASRIGALGYRIERVAKANRFDYPSTAVYYEPGGAAICGHLARQLGVSSRPLPGGTNPRRCVVIAGPPQVR